MTPPKSPQTAVDSLEQSEMNHLQQAEMLVTHGQAQIYLQQQFISQTEKAGENSDLAREVLAAFEDAQASRVANRDRLLNELSRD